MGYNQYTKVNRISKCKQQLEMKILNTTFNIVKEHYHKIFQSKLHKRNQLPELMVKCYRLPVNKEN